MSVSADVLLCTETTETKPSYIKLLDMMRFVKGFWGEPSFVHWCQIFIKLFLTHPFLGQLVHYFIGVKLEGRLGKAGSYCQSHRQLYVF